MRRQAQRYGHRPGLTGKALDQWAHQRGVTLRFIDRGKPIQNAHAESFNGRLRDECLNQHWFLGLADARRIIEAWRQDYNHHRPHSALGYRTPEEFRAESGATNTTTTTTTTTTTIHQKETRLS